MLRIDASTGPMEPILPSVRKPFNRVTSDSICEFIDSKRTYEFVVDGCIEQSLHAIRQLRWDAANTPTLKDSKGLQLQRWQERSEKPTRQIDKLVGNHSWTDHLAEVVAFEKTGVRLKIKAQ
jgi:hypothetical protein